jgi:hypothetical protein
MSQLVRRIRRRMRRFAYSDKNALPIGAKGRRKRMVDMLRLVSPPPGARVIDLGGTEYLWDSIEHDFQITLVNLPGSVKNRTPREDFEYIWADACDLGERVGDGAFDLAFSNSVIEHVGPGDRQRQFAAEIRRIGRAYWVQTPSIRFPIEVHMGYPLMWQWMRLTGQDLVYRDHIWGISCQAMERYFPDGQVYMERVAGFEKSYTLYRPYGAG